MTSILAKTRTWTIRKQMLVFYISSAVFILILVLILVTVNLLILGHETLSKVEETVDDQTWDNLKAVAREGSTMLWTKTM